jgi:uncharacterized small protein (DUF1192 family)
MSNEPGPSDAAEIAALFARLRDEVARAPALRSGPQTTGRGDAAPSIGRDQAERTWAVTVDRPFLYKPGTWGRIRGLLLAPVKVVLRKLMRWYVEPAFAQQRDFNTAVLRTLDELSERIDVLAEEVPRAAGKPSKADGESGNES